MKMRHNIFHIVAGDNELVYDPLAGSIANVRTGKIYSVRRRNDAIPLNAGIVADELAKNFKPNCLTIFSSHQCNLSCSYCYINDKENVAADVVDLAAVRAAAEIVARNSAEKGMPFVLGFHGGNEPLLDPQLVQKCVTACRAIADKYRLELLPFCTTNGVISAETAHWAAKTFYGIRLSWDGPAELHDAYRRKISGAGTSTDVAQSAKIFLNPMYGLKQLVVRTTVTRAAVSRLCGIVDYFHDQGIAWVEIYPAFQNADKSLDESILPTAEEFVTNFLRAQQRAHQNKMKLLFAGSRLNDLHDKHCPIFQNNLTLTPDGYVTACFQASYNFQQRNERFMYGHYDQATDELIIDRGKLTSLFDCLLQPYTQCKDCFNYFHCAKGCPTVCPLQPTTNDSISFPCFMENKIGMANILRTAQCAVDDGVLQNVTVSPVNIT